ncbi:outer membrane lipoprotein chaperone LolA [Marinicella sediminis]|uniref:Outer-membrane lipoprotein carrier protein n=1 Tax=Marinicella sediminis TaxID=1792834 RepID=A0ABV7JAA7_9GAMM|nr:outer membrane lipoprotein chaperone LolA [Marinicella sediminis]
MLIKKIGCVCLLMIVGYAAQAQNADPDPHKLLQALRTDLQGLTAAFKQYELDEGNRQLEINTGTVWMQSPDKFRWLYKDPIEQLIVADGEQVWVYDEDLEQVTVKEQDNALNPIYVIINDELSNQHYDINYELSVQGIDWVSLTPKVPSEEVKSVWLALEKNMVKQIKVFNQFDQVMVFEFYQTEKNPKLAADLFSFSPPEGVDVIRAIGD